MRRTPGVIVFIVLGCSLITSAAWGDILYVSSQASRHILKVSSAGAVNVFTSLPPSAAYPSGLAFDANGNLFASDLNKNTIHKITPDGTATLFKNLPSQSFPAGMAFDESGNLYVGNSSAHQINKITPAGTLSLFATLPAGSGSEDMAFDASGNLYVSGGDQIDKISPAGTVSRFANLPHGSSPFGLAFDAIGNLYVAEFLTDQISKITPGGTVTLFATLPTNTQPVGLAFDSHGNLYESGVLGEIHKITPDGTVSLFASDATESFLRVAVTDDVGKPLALPPAALSGDYNGNGTIDAPDYVTWRKNDGMQQGYDTWRANFGRTTGAGPLSDATVPEPNWMLLVPLVILASWNRYRSDRERS